jgi:hypothetical protein
VRRPLVVLALAVAIVAIAVAGTLFAVSERLGDDVVRVPDPFAALDPATRPVPTAAMTFLLVGTDSRSAEPTTGADTPAEAFGVATPTSSSGVAFQAGVNHLDGDTAPAMAFDVFLTAPVRGAGTEGGQSLVLLDDARGAVLRAALRDGTSAAYAQQHPDALLGLAPAGEEHP